MYVLCYVICVYIYIYMSMICYVMLYWIYVYEMLWYVMSMLWHICDLKLWKLTVGLCLNKATPHITRFSDGRTLVNHPNNIWRTINRTTKNTTIDSTAVCRIYIYIYIYIYIHICMYVYVRQTVRLCKWCAPPTISSRKLWLERPSPGFCAHFYVVYC